MCILLYLVGFLQPKITFHFYKNIYCTALSILRNSLLFTVCLLWILCLSYFWQLRINQAIICHDFEKINKNFGFTYLVAVSHGPDGTAILFQRGL